MAQRLIDPDAVIAPLKEEYKKVKQAFDETSVFQAPNDVALYGALMQEIGAVIGMIENAPTVDAEPHWIPCNERLPEEDCETGNGVQYSDFVLMSVEHKEDEVTIVDYGHTVDGKWYSDFTDCFIPQEWKVIAWMQLPKPYEVEK